MSIIAESQLDNHVLNGSSLTVVGWMLIAVFWILTIGVGANFGYILNSRSDVDTQRARLTAAALAAVLAFATLPVATLIIDSTLPLPLGTVMQTGLTAALGTFVLWSLWAGFRRRVRRGPNAR